MERRADQPKTAVWGGETASWKIWLEVKLSACNAGDLGSILGWEDPLEKGKATHSSILASRIPWIV